MDHLKRYMKSREIPIQIRMKLYFAISSDEDFRRLVRDGRVEEARELAEKLVEEYVSGSKVLDVEGIQF
jgi:precorrin-2 dehydrogenase/sirohydrochlorin ferrochelatase